MFLRLLVTSPTAPKMNSTVYSRPGIVKCFALMISPFSPNLAPNTLSATRQVASLNHLSCLRILRIILVIIHSGRVSLSMFRLSQIPHLVLILT